MKKVLLAILVSSSAAHAGGTEVAEQNAVSAGTGGAGAARDNDAGAAWHIPAALADDGGTRIGISLALAHPSLQAEGSTGWSAESENAWATPPHIDASYAHGRFAAGVALGVPFGGGVTWPSTWERSSEAINTQLIVLRAAPFAAYAVADGKLRIAAGLHFDAGRLQVERGLDFIDTQGTVKLDLDGRGTGVDASAFYAARPDLGIGLAFRSRTHITFDGNANFTTPDAFSEKTPDQTAQTHMTLPDQFVLGARWHRDTLSILGDITYTNWSVNQRTDVDFQMDQTPTATQMNEWHDTVGLRAGAELQSTRSLIARFGAYFDPSPVPAEHLTPTAPDATRVALTAGASYRINAAWSADAFAEQMWLLRRDTTSVDTMPASYGGTAVVLGAGVRWTPSAE
ncbi:MAG TPA: outer membrane protein transport protein [Kofleriaceae bacterium]|nr:outer membrane protein transport protein [Kofleriaceae bacterium]